MRTGRSVVWLVVGVGIGVGIVVAASILLSSVDTLEPVEEAEAQALLDEVRTGCEAAASAIQSGVGVISIHDTMWEENGERRETEATCQLVQRGESARVLFESLNAGGSIASSVTGGALVQTARQ